MLLATRLQAGPTVGAAVECHYPEADGGQGWERGVVTRFSADRRLFFVAYECLEYDEGVRVDADRSAWRLPVVADRAVKREDGTAAAAPAQVEVKREWATAQLVKAEVELAQARSLQAAIKQEEASSCVLSWRASCQAGEPLAKQKEVQQRAAAHELPTETWAGVAAQPPLPQKLKPRGSWGNMFGDDDSDSDDDSDADEAVSAAISHVGQQPGRPMDWASIKLINAEAAAGRHSFISAVLGGPDQTGSSSLDEDDGTFSKTQVGSPNNHISARSISDSTIGSTSGSNSPAGTNISSNNSISLASPPAKRHRSEPPPLEQLEHQPWSENISLRQSQGYLGGAPPWRVERCSGCQQHVVRDARCEGHVCCAEPQLTAAIAEAAVGTILQAYRVAADAGTAAGGRKVEDKKLLKKFRQEHRVSNTLGISDRLWRYFFAATHDGGGAAYHLGEPVGVPVGFVVRSRAECALLRLHGAPMDGIELRCASVSGVIREKDVYPCAAIKARQPSGAIWGWPSKIGDRWRDADGEQPYHPGATLDYCGAGDNSLTGQACNADAGKHNLSLKQAGIFGTPVRIVLERPDKTFEYIGLYKVHAAAREEEMAPCQQLRQFSKCVAARCKEAGCMNLDHRWDRPVPAVRFELQKMD